jgi:hypothetical protein
LLHPGSPFLEFSQLAAWGMRPRIAGTSLLPFKRRLA